MSEIPKWQASIHFLYPGEATSGRMAVYLAADVDAAIAAAEKRTRKLMIAECIHHQDLAFAAALHQAREAVDALANKTTHPWASIGDALAAIDALKEGEQA